jgi:hypothetical protein
MNTPTKFLPPALDPVPSYGVYIPSMRGECYGMVYPRIDSTAVNDFTRKINLTSKSNTRVTRVEKGAWKDGGAAWPPRSGPAAALRNAHECPMTRLSVLERL